MQPHRSLAILSFLIAALGVGACSKSGGDSAADAGQAAASQDEPAEAADAEPAEPALPKVDYWKPVVGAMQGSYGGNCVSGLDRKPAKDTVQIGADGTVTIGAFSATLRDGKTTLMRTPPGQQAEGVSLIGEAGELALTLNNFGPGNDDHVTVQYGDKAIACNNVKDVLPLDGKNLFTTYAGQFTVKPRKITCLVSPEMFDTKQVDFQLEGKSLKVGEHVFDLDKLATEQVILDSGGAFYAVSTQPQRLANVAFDEYGRLINVTVNGFDSGASYACGDLEREQN